MFLLNWISSKKKDELLNKSEHLFKPWKKNVLKTLRDA